MPPRRRSVVAAILLPFPSPTFYHRYHKEGHADVFCTGQAAVRELSGELAGYAAGPRRSALPAAVFAQGGLVRLAKQRPLLPP
eukprot:12409225-Heterocapsa_arctica.AAC.1